MTPSGAGTVTELDAWVPHVEARLAETACFSCQTFLLCLDPIRGAITRVKVGALLSTADPFSVTFPLPRRRGVLAIADPVPHTGSLAWHGIPCQLVRIRIGLPVVGQPTLRPFRLLALLPTRPVRDVPPFLRLGAEFLHANNASVRLAVRPARGELIIP